MALDHTLEKIAAKVKEKKRLRDEERAREKKAERAKGAPK
jgi:hypothetical protein